MDVLLYHYDDTVLMLDEHLIHCYGRMVTGSRSTPLIWAGAQLKPKHGDKIAVRIGSASETGLPFYNDEVMADLPGVFDIPTSEEPKLRAFLDEAAKRAAASVQAFGG